MSKNNTCKVCGCHIDKSACDTTWTTITKKNYWVGNKEIKGERIILCQDCARKIEQRLSELTKFWGNERGDDE